MSNKPLDPSGRIEWTRGRGGWQPLSTFKNHTQGEKPQLEHTSDGTTANPSKLVCEKCKQAYTYQTLGSFGCLGYYTDINQAEGIESDE